VVSVSTQLINGSEVSVLWPPVNRDKMYYLIEVKDNCIRFEQADAERIFNVFTRLHGMRNTEVQVQDFRLYRKS
jgi:light-regulated signal transduction histidine kinase (bacteriophytochrome)